MERIKSLRRDLAKKHHPDLGGDVDSMAYLLSIWDNYAALVAFNQAESLEALYDDSSDETLELAEPDPSTVVMFGFETKTAYSKFKKHASTRGITFKATGMKGGYYIVEAPYSTLQMVISHNGAHINETDLKEIEKTPHWMKQRCHACGNMVTGVESHYGYDDIVWSCRCGAHWFCSKQTAELKGKGSMTNHYGFVSLKMYDSKGNPYYVNTNIPAEERRKNPERFQKMEYSSDYESLCLSVLFAKLKKDDDLSEDDLNAIFDAHSWRSPKAVRDEIKAAVTEKYADSL